MAILRVANDAVPDESHAVGKIASNSDVNKSVFNGLVQRRGEAYKLESRSLMFK